MFLNVKRCPVVGYIDVLCLCSSLAVAEKYVSAFQELARTNNTLILPANTGDVSGMVGQVRRAKKIGEWENQNIS